MNAKLNRILRSGIPIYTVILVICAGAAVYFHQYYLAAAEGIGAAVLLIYGLVQAASRKRQIVKYIQASLDSSEIAEKAEAPFPKVTIDPDFGTIIWSNELFRKLVGNDSLIGSDVRESVPTFNLDVLNNDNGRSVPPEILFNGRRYFVYNNIAIQGDGENRIRVANLYFFEMTGYLKIRDEYVASRPIVSIILVDNFEELTAGLSDNDISGLNVQINTAVIDWTAGKHGLLRKLDRNRYLFVFESRYLEEMSLGNFSLLESVRKVVSNTGIQATVSIGIGKDGKTYEEAYSFAELSVEMALSRGGDQVVIKDRYNFTFFSGRGKEAGSRTKVKARVTAASLAELIKQSSSVYIMGHANADLDSVGAASGVYAICRKFSTPAKIIVDYKQNASQQVLDMLSALPEYREAFVNGETALLSADSKSLLVVVDTNRPDQIQYKPLLNSIGRIVVIDHHRRAADYIENVVLSLHEPSASSASELVADLLQYSVEPSDVLPAEAIALLAGIVLDTKQFSVRTGNKTFESAAFLERLGGDPISVKKLMQNDFATTLRKYEIIQRAQKYRQEVAICVLDQQVDRVTAAQAADELINISDIATSFVVFPLDGRVVISARSIGDVNVQLILEPLGGGGNPATAGAQISGSDIKTVTERLVASIEDYYKKRENTAQERE